MSGRDELIDERSEGIGGRQPLDLVAELEVVEDVLDVGGEPVQVHLEVGPQLLTAAGPKQASQREGRGVVELLPRRLSQRTLLGDDAGVVQHLLALQHLILGGFQHRVKSPQHRHRQYDVPVFAPHVQVAQHVVGHAPDETRDPAQL